MLELTRTDDSAAVPTETEVHAKIVELLTARGNARERYAALRNRARTQAADALIAQIRDDLEKLEQTEGKRVYKRRAASEAKFAGAIERFVGDLLRVRAGTTALGNIYRVLGHSEFGDASVKYDTFTQVLEGLKTLGLVGHQKGQSRYRKTLFGNAPIPGQAARFWPTSKLLSLAAHYGIDNDNIGDHFAPEPPKNPLVLKGYATGKGKDRESGKRIKYKNTRFDTPEAKRLEADVDEVNEFLARFEILGGDYFGYERTFNNLSWKKGGRLYSGGEDSYQRVEVFCKDQPLALPSSMRGGFLGDAQSPVSQGCFGGLLSPERRVEARRIARSTADRKGLHERRTQQKGPESLWPRPIWCCANHIISRQRPPDPLQLELTNRLDLHGVLDLRQHSRADEYLPRLGLVT
jgi:hypothetical protein